MSLSFSFHTNADTKHEIFSPDELLKAHAAFKSIIDDEKYGFFHLTSDHRHIEKCQTLFEKYKDRKYFVQVGIGGSALGPQMLLDALKKDHSRHFVFMDNIDSEYLQDQLNQINLKESLFYIVSKSGGTAETVACFAILRTLLKAQGVAEQDFNRYFVFCTDPLSGELRDMADKENYDTLEVPSNIGGRFSVLTAVGLFPALFAGIDIAKLFAGANAIKVDLLKEDIDHNPLLQSAAHLYYLWKKQNVGQTIIMPYSSKLRTLGHWFVQLWGESLGKFSKQHEQNVGLTPIPAYGATDQHSQMQLFMEGPNDKCLLMLDVKNRAIDFTLENNVDQKSFKKLSGYTLNQLMEAEFNGSLQALKEQKRNFIHLQIEKNDEAHIGKLVLFFESLTALMGHYLAIDPFNQPGVEKGKIYAYQYLNSLK